MEIWVVHTRDLRDVRWEAGTRVSPGAHSPSLFGEVLANERTCLKKRRGEMTDDI